MLLSCRPTHSWHDGWVSVKTSGTSPPDDEKKNSLQMPTAYQKCPMFVPSVVSPSFNWVQCNYLRTIRAYCNFQQQSQFSLLTVLRTMHPFKFMASPPFTHNLLFDALFSNANVKIEVINIKSFPLLFTKRHSNFIGPSYGMGWRKSKTSDGLGKKLFFT